MKSNWQRYLSLFVIAATVSTVLIFMLIGRSNINVVFAQTGVTPTPLPAAFDQKAAIAKLREQIKGKENEPAEMVFKNIQTPMFKGSPAMRLLAVMELGYARSLGVSCTHCHVPENWDSESKPQKQIARDMAAMMARINGELLPGIKNLGVATPTVNCTTCHRGEIKPATNLPAKL
jgi:hypothetical protein